MRWNLILLLSLVAVSARAGECLSVSENALEEIKTEYGMTTAEWSARVQNNCDAAYDGTLTVRFIDNAGEILHETLDIIILKHNASERTSKRITLPANRYKAVEDIKVEIMERERPS